MYLHVIDCMHVIEYMRYNETDQLIDQGTVSI